MGKIFIVLIIAVVIFTVFKGNERKKVSNEDILRADVEHQVRGAFAQLGEEMVSSSSQSSTGFTSNSNPKPNNVPTIYSKQVCDDAEKRCSQIMNLKNNAPPNTKFDATFNEGVEWCAYVIEECGKRNF